ncbi:uncharacterized protein LOC121873711 [Homarus americanus]|uniref:uncharacterized protein LOC121873711 n=1 Tax=Homarus americanus TaxID=6706 RepID=UPI001C447CA5|nr:uncharacterized protein LOC121873711 [Homarus americanus]
MFGCKVMLKMHAHKPPVKQEDMVVAQEIEELLGNKTFSSYRERKQPVSVKKSSSENVALALGGKFHSTAASTSHVKPEFSTHHKITSAETEGQKNTTVDVRGILGNRTKGMETLSTHGKRGKKTLAKKERQAEEKTTLDLLTRLKRNGLAIEKVTEPKDRTFITGETISPGGVEPTSGSESVSKVGMSFNVKHPTIEQKIPCEARKLRPVKKVECRKGRARKKGVRKGWARKKGRRRRKRAGSLDLLLFSVIEPHRAITTPETGAGIVQSLSDNIKPSPE